MLFLLSPVPGKQLPECTMNFVLDNVSKRARMAKLADARDLKSRVLNRT